MLCNFGSCGKGHVFEPFPLISKVFEVLFLLGNIVFVKVKVLDKRLEDLCLS